MPLLSLEPKIFLKAKSVLGTIPSNQALDRTRILKPLMTESRATLTDQGNQLLAAGQYPQALTHFDQAIAAQPLNYQAWYGRSNALQGLGNPEPAKHSASVAVWTEAIVSNPNDENAWQSRGQALGKLERHEEAIESYNRALELQPKNPEAFWLRGKQYEQLGQYDSALADFSQALAILPENLFLWQSRGALLCDRLGRYEEALADFNKAFTIACSLERCPTSAIQGWVERSVRVASPTGENPTLGDFALGCSAGGNPTYNCLIFCLCKRHSSVGGTPLRSPR